MTRVSGNDVHPQKGLGQGVAMIGISDGPQQCEGTEYGLDTLLCTFDSIFRVQGNKNKSQLSELIILQMFTV